jgi:hypothetical protein
MQNRFLIVLMVVSISCRARQETPASAPLPPAQTTSSSQAAQDTASKNKPRSTDPCSWLSIQEGAELLGVSAADLQTQKTEHACSYFAANLPNEKKVQVYFEVQDGPAFYDKYVQDKDANAVTGVGDRAVAVPYTLADGLVAAVKGGRSVVVRVNITPPPTTAKLREKAVEATKKIVSRM